MFKKLQQKWNVGAVNLLLIIATFAIGGSLCGFLGRKLMQLTQIEKGVIWVLIYILLITLIWPLCVLLVSIPLGQFNFFKKYLSKIFKKFTPNKKTEQTKNRKMINIALFASGAGSNAEIILKTLSSYINTDIAKVAVIISNKKNAGVLKIADSYNVPSEIVHLNIEDTNNETDSYLDILKKYHIGFIVLAGYLKKIPLGVIQLYPQKIVNIHPALLPAYGGAGMYGSKVHEAVIAAGKISSGITIHYVDEIYDNGEIIFQASCKLSTDETASSLAQKIHALEHRHYTEQIAKLLLSQIPVK